MSLNDKLEDVKIEEIKSNWNIPNKEEDLPIQQKLLLHLLEEISELKERITALEVKKQ